MAETDLPLEVIERLKLVEISDRVQRERETSVTLNLILTSAMHKSVDALEQLSVADPANSTEIMELQQHARFYPFMIKAIDQVLQSAEEAQGALSNGLSDYEE